MKCRVCESKCELLDTLTDKEPNVTSMYKEPTHTKKLSIDLYRCPQCTHMQIEWLNSEDYYDSYMLSTEEGTNTYSPNFFNHYRDLIKELSSYAKTHHSILDMGCGPGIIMDLEEEFFDKSIGVEPSKPEAELAKRRGKDVINAYFDRNLDVVEYNGGGGILPLLQLKFLNI